MQAFQATVEAGDYVGAIRQFYTDDATMQENLGTVRAGREAPAAEETALKTVRITTRPGTAYAVDGDRVAVRWVFDIVQADGRKYTLDELAYQLGAATASLRSGSTTIRRSAGRSSDTTAQKKTNGRKNASLDAGVS